MFLEWIFKPKTPQSRKERLDERFLEAVSKHQLKKAGKFLDQGASVFAHDGEGNTALHKLAAGYPREGDYCNPLGFPEFSGLDAFVRLLLERQLDINVCNEYGETCLHTVAQNGWDIHPEKGMMDIFINHGADPNKAAATGIVPLQLVHLVAAALRLINAGAKTDVKDSQGRNLLYQLIISGSRCTERERLIQFYLENFPLMAGSKNAYKEAMKSDWVQNAKNAKQVLTAAFREACAEKVIRQRRREARLERSRRRHRRKERTSP